MLSIEERARYESDLGVSWLRLPGLFILALVAAAGLAWVLKIAFSTGWYLIILVPGIGGVALGGVLYALVGWARCRNRWLAGAVGVLAGVGGYLGYYQLCLNDALPPLAWHIDLLPDYVVFRMQTDVSKDVDRPDNGQNPETPSVPLNWFTFAWELAMVVGASAGFAWSRARHAYCPELRQWMRREKALLPAEHCGAFPEALESGRLGDFVANAPPAGDPQAACRFIVEYTVPSGGSPFDYPIYASLHAPPGTRPWHLLRNMRRTSLRQVRLEPVEVLELQPLFPKLAAMLSSRHPELSSLPPAVAAPTPEVPASEVAQITPVPEPFRRRVRRRGYALQVNLIGLAPGVLFFGGFGLVAGGIWLATEKSLPLGWAAVAAGVVGLLLGGYTGLYCLCVFENRWINRRLRYEIAQRPDALVDSRDPEGMYVSLIPRESFAEVRLTMSSDLLLLKIDDRGGRLVMEGDSDRYRIPAGAISICEPQCFFHPIDTQHQNQLWMVRLVVRVEDGSRELLLSVGATRWSPVTNARRRQMAEAMCLRINKFRATRGTFIS